MSDSTLTKESAFNPFRAQWLYDIMYLRPESIGDVRGQCYFRQQWNLLPEALRAKVRKK